MSTNQSTNLTVKLSEERKFDVSYDKMVDFIVARAQKKEFNISYEEILKLCLLVGFITTPAEHLYSAYVRIPKEIVESVGKEPESLCDLLEKAFNNKIFVNYTGFEASTGGVYCFLLRVNTDKE